MGRMHSNGKGKSRSALPYKRSSPSWLKINTTEVRGAPWRGLARRSARRRSAAPPLLPLLVPPAACSQASHLRPSQWTRR